jgi:hypothetical protein
MGAAWERLGGLSGDVPRSVLDNGRIEPKPSHAFPGPQGAFKLLPEEYWRTLAAGFDQAPAPVFLHESFEARLEKWVQPIRDASRKVAVVGEVRDAVTTLVDSRITADPQAFSVTPTVTSTEETNHGTAVVGRCVVLRPAGS